LNDTKIEEATPRKPLRLWPGVALVVLQALVVFVVPVVVPEAAGIGVIGGAVGGLLVVLWWLLASRAPWLERLGAIVLMALGLWLTPRILHPSIAGGMMGFMFYIYEVPVLGFALVAWAVITRGLPDPARRASMVAALLLAFAALGLVRTGGMTGDADSELHWRWTETPEERLLARGSEAVAPAPVLPEQESTAEWPGFRGPARDGVVRGVRIATDWSATPPVELWRRPVGPGWSSFAVHGGLLYTQEQRGDDEEVTCYDATSGQPVWRHADAARFWESNAGAGPRATPTLDGGRVYTCGATGVVNALDAADGSVAWSRDAAADTERRIPDWGFAGSPLVLDDVVIVAAGGRLVGYDVATGQPRWLGPQGGWGYGSPHPATIDGVRQVLLLDGAGVIAVAPEDGATLWRYGWRGDGIVQPILLAGNDVLIGTGSGLGNDVGMGVRRVALTRGDAGWSAEERWTSTGLKPYFNDYVAHGGYAFGFDGSILACIDLANGERRWKGGRYGHGQLILLADQGLLLVLSEKGELALVAASPDRFEELARVPAIEGKTWNHPVLVGDRLFVRNDREMAAFRLASVAVTAGGEHERD